MAHQFVVGIDLGTTHTVVAFAPVDAPIEAASLSIFPIPQCIGPGQVAARPLLPSFRYHPLADEFAPADLCLPWTQAGDATLAPIIGEWARELGARRQGQLIASAKSWLSHDRVDREAAILPWGSEVVERVSPVEASAGYLAHVRAAWDHAHPEAPLAEQTLILTVPASFDEAARAYTLEAARLAGLPGVRLLEEPQAVCYDWALRHRSDAAAVLGDSRLMLVVDVGGGTTDLSLIRIEPSDGAPALTRIAVGDHLMLGGDNLDLALARHLEPQLAGEGQRLGASALMQVIQQTRQAKERLLADDAPDSASVTLVGSGSRLIGGARTAMLERSRVHDLALDGFLPLTLFEEGPRQQRSAFVEFGLPYVADAAISRHLAAFFHAHADACREAVGGGVADTVICNGGFFHTALLRDRLREVLEHWSGRPVRMLDNPHPDRAVALGAAASGLLRRRGERTIGGGSARSFFLVVDAGAGERQAVCLLPKGTPEGQSIDLQGRRFSLTVGQPVSFPLASFSGDRAVQVGDAWPIDMEGMLLLPPLTTRLDADSQASTVNVVLSARLDESGVLQVACMDEQRPERRWALEFSIRSSRQSVDLARLPPRFGEAEALLVEVFQRSDRQFDPRRLKSVREEIERLLGPREQWTLPLSRALADVLIRCAPRRRRSAAHERLWFNLTGFCLRPGFGYPLDDWRVDQCWALWSSGLQHAQEIQAWSEWWTFWRRLAGGLSPARQTALADALAPYLNPAHGRHSKIQTELKVRSLEDMLRLAGSLEALPIDRKIEWGGWCIQRLGKAGESATLWWMLGRLGARVPFHAGIDQVVPVSAIHGWWKTAMAEDWKKNPQAAFAAVMMSRRCDDRSRDLDDVRQADVVQKLRAAKASPLWISLVSEAVTLDAQEQRRVFGEALPVGLAML